MGYRPHSVYEVECARCQAPFEAPEKECACPRCGQAHRLSWPDRLEQAGQERAQENEEETLP